MGLKRLANVIEQSSKIFDEGHKVQVEEENQARRLGELPRNGRGLNRCKLEEKARQSQNEKTVLDRILS